MSSQELAREINELLPLPVEHMVERDPAVIQTREESSALDKQRQEALEKERSAARLAAAWRNAHPMQARLYQVGLARAPYLDEQARLAAEAAKGRVAIERRIQKATPEWERIRADAAKRIAAEQGGAWAKVAELRKLRDTRARQERDAVEQERERDRIVELFKGMAHRRLIGASDYRDGSSGWAATPQPLREAIDKYNRLPPAQQAETLAHIRNNVGARKFIADAVRQRERDMDRGMDR